MEEVKGPEQLPPPETSPAISPNEMNAPIAPRWHTLVLIGIIAITSVAGAFSQHKEARGGHLITQYVSQMIWEWLIFAFCVWGAKRGGHSFRDLLGGKWQEFEDFLLDVAIGVGAWIGCYIAAAIVAFSLGVTRHPEAVREARSRIDFLFPHTRNEIIVAILLAITAGICEETIFRAYFLRQLKSWTRSAVVGVIGSSLLFGAAHGYQTWWQMVVIVFIGLVLGTTAQLRKSIRPVILSHTLIDTVSLLAGRFVKV